MVLGMEIEDKMFISWFRGLPKKHKLLIALWKITGLKFFLRVFIRHTGNDQLEYILHLTGTERTH